MNGSRANDSDEDKINIQVKQLMTLEDKINIQVKQLMTLEDKINLRVKQLMTLIKTKLIYE